MAVLRLPFVYLGLSRDLWRESLVAYLSVERGLGSTFFVIPFRGRPGRQKDGPAPARRGAGYGADDIEPELRELAACAEVGLHGIDAWCDAAAGRVESTRISRSTGCQELGVRMHWLYFDERSHRLLEDVGFSYDSTVGYNETIGFRAGTLQVFRPLGADHLMELPLHVMDTSLFYPDRLNLGFGVARGRIAELAERATQFGGELTFNWHDRSIAPERLWKDFYVDTLNELKSRGAWFPTASQAVTWFRARRSAKIECLTAPEGSIRIRVTFSNRATGPGLRLRVHRPAGAAGTSVSNGRSSFVDLPLQDGEMTLAV